MSWPSIGAIKPQRLESFSKMETYHRMEKKEQRDTLEGVLQEVWKMLKRGAVRFNDPFHRPALGTTGENGPGLRTVILRQFILPDRVLVCHTDARAAKVKEIFHVDRVAWLFYHPRRKIQLKITGWATLHADDRFADQQWAAVKATSRLNYCAVEAPGTSIERPSAGLPDFLLNKIPTLLESERGRKNFMVVAARIDSMDWLNLRVLGNRRARFIWDKNGLSTTWLIP
jgi:pyridoxamine 5'-phosphate oxidase